MALTIPDIQNITNGVNGYDGQTLWDTVDIAALGAANNGYGVFTGCQLGAIAGSPYAASLSAGTTLCAGQPVSVSSAASIVFATASSTDRRDIVVANSAGGVGVVQGTACGTAGWVRTTNALGPVKPSFGGSVICGEVYIPGGAASVSGISAIMITDKTCVIQGGNQAKSFYLGNTFNPSATTATNCASLTLGVGTWQIIGQITAGKTSATLESTAFWIGPNTGSISGAYVSGQADFAATAGGTEYVTVTLTTVQTLTSSTTVYLGIYVAAAITDVYAVTPQQSIANCTGLVAVPLY